MTPLPAHEEPSSGTLKGTVLYIEDEPVSFELVRALLELQPGIRLLRAPTGAEGIRLALAESPDAVLLDMHLPDTSGIEVVRHLSEHLAAGRFRVILLTTERLNIDVLKAMSLGASEYLLKPVRQDVLESALRRALDAGERARASGRRL